MVLKEDQAKVKALLTEAITVLCKNGLSYRNEFSVEGLLGVTLDNEEVFLISINETIREIGGQNMSPNPPSVQRRSPMPAPQRGQMGKGRGTPPANRARVNQGMQNARKRSLDGEFKNTHPQQGSTPGTPSHPSPHSSMGSPPGTPGTPQQLPGQTDPDQPPIKRLNDDGTQDGDDTLLEDGSANLAKIKSEPGSIPTGDGADWDSTQTDQHDPNNQAMQMPSFGDEFNLQGAMDPAMNVKMEQTGQIPQHSGGAGPGMTEKWDQASKQHCRLVGAALSVADGDKTCKATVAEPVDLTWSRTFKPRNLGTKSALKSIDSCISMKFYGGAPSAASGADSNLGAGSEKNKAKNRRRSIMFRKYIPYTEKTFPLNCSLTSEGLKSPSENLSVGDALCDGGSSTMALSHQHVNPLGTKALQPISAHRLNTPSPMLSPPGAYFPCIYPVPFHDGMPNVSDSVHFGTGIDTTEPYTRSVLNVSNISEPATSIGYQEVLSSQTSKHSSATGVVRDSNDISLENDEPVAIESKENRATGSGRTYKMKQPVKCRYCDRTFWSHTGRYYHEAIHTGKWLFQCKYCDTGFMQRKAYDSHMRAKHKVHEFAAVHVPLNYTPKPDKEEAATKRLEESSEQE